MKKLLGLIILGFIVTSSVVALAVSSLLVVYPPNNHQTSAEKIFLIGTAPLGGQVLINGKPINRSQAGHFAPSFPLQLGENLFTVSHQNQKREIQVNRLATQPELPQGLAFAKDSLIPAADIARLSGELICFSAIAPPNASVSVNLANQTISLAPQPQQVSLPSNSAALIGSNQPTAQFTPGKYEGCTTLEQSVSPTSANNTISATQSRDLGKPEFQLTLNGQTITQTGTGNIQILSPANLEVVEVVADAGVARTGPSTDYSRLTPLPKGTQASVTGGEGEWLRLDYGGWINGKETRVLPGAIPPRTTIRSVGYRRLPSTTEMVFPLQVPVPVSVQQSNDDFTLTLYNTTAQTDTIRLDDDPLISRLDWQQVTPVQAQYTFNLKKAQQWGYKLRYEDTTLVLALRHPPTMGRERRKPLSGIKILLDPGHGGKESGAVGPTGYPEKEVNLVVSKLFRDELVNRGATVVMTRETDVEVSLGDRMAMIDKEEPAIALSVHYNALPDSGDAENTKGIGTFWYHPQAHNLAIFMQNYLVKKLNRPDYGVFWNNLALTRPSSAPSVLLELGFMINPQEFEWLTNSSEQKKLAKVLAEGVVDWFKISH
ncbi:N-acetylmuramoyl-L-alanine amidase [Nodularia sphaerocarpa]|uniref:N-acetylmuramoyl-L-alanine amidase n=1 Tax=Nodularia sphaerocarpa TaxID=137816 RepID=UPI001EFA79D9|nr:N-acetylmuramoyl-L-alanine amidase [Nodularia sphaerocarpa]MDB9375244.1 N-acetylmuramoyl-L-alanine amidase [Nodularia sphaerocarpa CS-585]MDB9376514.1 N-acetylmuramoyl-L-alanine amidase [Nodularia sphaerocarpa CS-585A2]ULP72595.1 N-acetylmuramoyl-L-alanine amidase LytC [Nodularia sphaerocarpa UHCC 0038]